MMKKKKKRKNEKVFQSKNLQHKQETTPPTTKTKKIQKQKYMQETKHDFRSILQPKEPINAILFKAF